MRILFLEYIKPYIRGIPYGFRDLGCEVEIMTDFNYRSLDYMIRSFKPDLIMTAGWTQIHVQEKMKALAKLTKKYKIKHVYWATEDPIWTEEWSLPLIKLIDPDCIFTISRETIPLYHQLGYKAEYLQWGCHPYFHRQTIPQSQYQADISIVATAPTDIDSYRGESFRILLEPLLYKNYNLKIYGGGWEDSNYLEKIGVQVPEKYLHGELDFDLTNEIYSSSKIMLGFQNNVKERTQRTVEILSAKGFLLAPKTEAIESTFTHKEHLIVSSSPEETLELVDYYLEHDDERQAIALKGQQEVHLNHHYREKAAQILDAVTS